MKVHKRILKDMIIQWMELWGCKFKFTFGLLKRDAVPWPRSSCTSTVRYYFWIRIQLLFNYCSVFWSWKCIPGILILLTTTICRDNKHHTRTRFDYFRLSIGFSKAWYHHRRWPGYEELISLTGVEEGDSVP